MGCYTRINNPRQPNERDNETVDKKMLVKYRLKMKF